jgi:predicted ArsR family transcriptional regulator
MLLHMPEVAPRITDAKALRALAHPLRMQLLDIVGREGSATATQCANETGESVANCSYHLNTLAKYGFIEPAEGGRGREKHWRVGREDFSINSREMDEDGAIAARAATGAFLDFQLNQIKERTLTDHLNPPEWQPATGVDTSREYLTPSELSELRDEIHQLMEKYRDRRDKPELRPAGARRVTIFVSSSIAPPRD